MVPESRHTLAGTHILRDVLHTTLQTSSDNQHQRYYSSGLKPGDISFEIFNNENKKSEGSLPPKYCLCAPAN